MYIIKVKTFGFVEEKSVKVRLSSRYPHFKGLILKPPVNKKTQYFAFAFENDKALDHCCYL